MSDEPDNLTVRYLRRFDEKLDRVQGDVLDLKHRMTNVERQIGELRADEQSHYAATMGRLDQVAGRLDRIEIRLDLVQITP